MTYQPYSYGLGRGLSSTLNQNGTVTMTLYTGRRAYRTLLHWQVIPYVDDRYDPPFWESSSVVDSHSLPPTGDSGGYYDTFAAWDYSGWNLIGTTNSVADADGKSFSWIIPAVTTRSILVIREGVYKHAGDEAWVNANKGSNGLAIVGANVRSEWYQSSGAVGFYYPVAVSYTQQDGWSFAGSYNSGVYNGVSDLEFAGRMGAIYLGRYSNPRADVEGFAVASSQNVDAPRAFYPRGTVCGFPYESDTYHGRKTFESSWVPRYIPVSITANKSALAEGETATVTFSHTSNNVLEFAERLVGESASFAYRWANGLMPQNGTRLEIGVDPTTPLNAGLLEVSGGSIGPLAGSVPPNTAGWQADGESYLPAINGTVSISGTFTAASNFNGAAQISLNTSTLNRGTEVLKGSLSTALGVGTTNPTVVSMTATPATLAASQRARVSVQLSSPSVDFKAGDITASNCTVSGFRGNGKSYEFVVTPPTNKNGNAAVTIAANAFTGPFTTKNLTSASLTIPFDTVAPQATLASNASTLTANQTANITLSLSEAVVVTANGSSNVAGVVSVSGGTLSSWSGNGTKYNATFTPSPNTTATATLTVPANALQDAFGNRNASSRLDVLVRTGRPTVDISSSSLKLGSGQTAIITFRLSADSQSFAASDIAVTGGSLSGFRGAGRTYTAKFTPTANALVNAMVSVAAGAFSDDFGNTNTAGQLPAPIRVDTRPLQPAVSASVSTVSLASRSKVTLTFTFNKPPASFAANDITVTGGTLTQLRRVSTSYTAVVTPSAVGQITASVRAGLTDEFGNVGVAASLSAPVTVTN